MIFLKSNFFVFAYASACLYAGRWFKTRERAFVKEIGIIDFIRRYTLDRTCKIMNIFMS